MKKSIFIAGMVAIGWAFSGPVIAKDVSEVPKVISETVFYKDMSAYFYGQLPFLKKGITFLDASKSLSAEEGALSSLVVQGPGKPKESDTPGQSIRVTKDFAPFVDKIKSDKEAMTYVQFLSRKGFPWMESLRFDYFEDVPFLALDFVGVSTTAVALNGIKPPKIGVQTGKLLGKKTFVVVRTVVPLDQPALAEKKILSGATPLVLSELAEATERVSESGDYAFSLRRFPVKQFAIQNPLVNLRKPAKK